jgi:LPXTG-motif cell wall-anchored protein
MEKYITPDSVQFQVEQIFPEDTEITKFPSAIDLLDGVTAKPDEVVDTPTTLKAGTKDSVGFIIIGVVFFITIFFILKRKK